MTTNFLLELDNLMLNKNDMDITLSLKEISVFFHPKFIPEKIKIYFDFLENLKSKDHKQLTFGGFRCLSVENVISEYKNQYDIIKQLFAEGDFYWCDDLVPFLVTEMGAAYFTLSESSGSLESSIYGFYFDDGDIYKLADSFSDFVRYCSKSKNYSIYDGKKIACTYDEQSIKKEFF